MAAWYPTHAHAFDITAHAVYRRLVPRGDLAVIHGIIAAISEAGPTVTPEGLRVLSQCYINLWYALGGTYDGKVRNMLRIGYALNAPRTRLDPRRFTDPATRFPRVVPGVGGDATFVAPKYTRLPPPNLITLTTTCPVNLSGSACFTNTPFVILFLATDAYDVIFSAARPPDEYRVMAGRDDREKAAMGDTVSDDVVDWCDAKTEQAGPDRALFEIPDKSPDAIMAERGRILEIARSVGWEMRVPGESQRIDQNIGMFRNALSQCFPPEWNPATNSLERPLSVSQDEAGIVYNALVSMTGWAVWFMPVIVTLTVWDGIVIGDGYVVPVDPPLFRSTQLAISPLSKSVKLSSAMARTLQQFVDAKLNGGAEVSRDTHNLTDSASRDLLTHLRDTGQYGVVDIVQASFQGKVTIQQTERDVMLRDAPGGVLVFDATGMRFSKRYDPQTQRVEIMRIAPVEYIALSDGLRITVDEGWPNARKALSYRVFAVMVHAGNTPQSGHYYCYFWHTENVRDAFYFNDSQIQRVESDGWDYAGNAAIRGISRTELMLDDIAEYGLYFFMQRVDIEEQEPPPGSPSGNPYDAL